MGSHAIRITKTDMEWISRQAEDDWPMDARGFNRR